MIGITSAMLTPTPLLHSVISAKLINLQPDKEAVCKLSMRIYRGRLGKNADTNFPTPLVVHIVAPSTSLYLPGGQYKQALEPASGEYLPALHAVHLTPPSTVPKPAAHGILQSGHSAVNAVRKRPRNTIRVHKPFINFMSAEARMQTVLITDMYLFSSITRRECCIRTDDYLW